MLVKNGERKNNADITLLLSLPNTTLVPLHPLHCALQN